MRKHLLFIISFCIYGCSEPYQITVEPDGTKIITGMCDRNVLSSESDVKEWYDPHYSEYQADKLLLAGMDSLSRNVSFVVFLGTWCGDSKREVPRFFKIIDEAKISSDKITMYGLDRSKRSDDGMTDKYNIHLVPTIIVMKGEEELGRIVESPQETLEKDLAQILSRQ